MLIISHRPYYCWSPPPPTRILCTLYLHFYYSFWGCTLYSSLLLSLCTFFQHFKMLWTGSLPHSLCLIKSCVSRDGNWFSLFWGGCARGGGVVVLDNELEPDTQVAALKSPNVLLCEIIPCPSSARHWTCVIQITDPGVIEDELLTEKKTISQSHIPSRQLQSQARENMAQSDRFFIF